MKTKILYATALLTGLGLVYIGAKFIIKPEVAEAAFGIHFNEHGDYSFHYIKGARDIFTGLIISLLVLTNQRKALALTLFAGTIIPTTDMLIVLSKGYTGVQQAIPHIIAIIICIVVAPLLLLSKTHKPVKIKTTGFLKLIHTAGIHKESIIELNILPGEKTPWHYHTLFTETFEILRGALEVGRNKETYHLKQGDSVTIKPRETHYYNNISGEECVIKATIAPGNTNFENSLLIFKGLANDGLASEAGIPKKLPDLALFLHLNNSKMVGFGKVAAPLFNYLAARGIKNGRLDELLKAYCKR